MDSHKVFPPGLNQHALSALVFLLPYVEQSAVYDPIASQNFSFTPWSGTQCQAKISTFLCPSDGPAFNDSEGADDPQRGNHSYVFSRGDAFRHNSAASGVANILCAARPHRGVFGYFGDISDASIQDGMSNTVAVSEAVKCSKTEWDHPLRGRAAMGSFNAVIPLDCVNAIDPVTRRIKAALAVTSGDNRRGMRWADGRDQQTGFVTATPPNSPTCTGDSGNQRWALASPSSYHPGGVNVAMCDGSVHFISETIDTGDLTVQTFAGHNNQYTSGPSPYGVWGALGSTTGGEAASIP
jgi:prepilin-type processing-associated H-X9-DG protein